MNHDRSNDPCPKCGGETHQDSVDVGVGVIHGPRGCIVCGWSEDPEYDMTDPENRKATEHGGYKDQFGGLHPKGSLTAAAFRMAEREEKKE
jgi:hypothetical protein